jgi:hypothetical protein
MSAGQGQKANKTKNQTWSQKISLSSIIIDSAAGDGQGFSAGVVHCFDFQSVNGRDVVQKEKILADGDGHVP